mgnify:CR=1 FL=1
MSTYPPGGWSTLNGTWGTDMDRETSIVQEGANAIKFKSTATVISRAINDYYPVTPGNPYLVKTLLRADDNTKDVQAALYWYSAAKVALVPDHTNIFYDTLPAADTWYEISSVLTAPAGAYFARVLVGRVAASFNVYAAFAGVQPYPAAFSAYLDADTGYSTGDTIVCDVEFFDYGSNYDTATGDFTAPADGVYAFQGRTIIDDLNAGDFAVLGFRVNGTLRERGGSCFVHANNDIPYLAINSTMLLSRGDAVDMIIGHNEGGSPNALGDVAGAYPTTFSGYKVE